MFFKVIHSKKNLSPRKGSEGGFVLISTLLLVSALLGLLAIYYQATSHELSATRFTKGSSSGFYAAEAALNVRAQDVREIFVGYNRPSGTTTNTECQGSSQGSGDYICSTLSLNNRDVTSFVEEHADNPRTITIPPGERYQNLSAQEYLYTVRAQAKNNQDTLEANLELQFKSRLVPLFQFAVFYNKDLEILPGPTMSLSGPVHTNGDLYLNCDNRLSVSGQVTTAGDLYRGRKDGAGICSSKPVEVKDPGNFRSLIPTCSSRTYIPPTNLNSWRGMIQSEVEQVTVPNPEEFDMGSSKWYWSIADLRLVMLLDASNNLTEIQVQNNDQTNNSVATTAINACSGVVSGKAVGRSLMRNWRENKEVRLLDIDVQGVLDCLFNSNWFGSGKTLNESSQGGLVFHASVSGPNSASVANSYGIRLRNGSTLASTVSGSPAIKGLTVISDQAAYIFGDYNSINKKPAAVMADSLNVLSTTWTDAASYAGSSHSTRPAATATTINAALLAGTDSSGGVEGAGGQGSSYNGGLENYPRFHEDWNNKLFTYRGSFVSLNRARHVNGAWSGNYYRPPIRDWNYDVDFNNADKLPPATPRFVYLKQELFVRDFNE
jgi:hypothetical protein